jgi:flagellar biosynthesis/type III secretory pathway M-ring protein FliF/YscJ
MDIDSKKNLGWIIILIMLFSIMKNLFVLLYFGFINMRKKMKAMFSAEDEQLDSPHTSDDNSDTIDSIDTDEIEEEVQREEKEREMYNERIKQRQADRKQKEAEAP